MVDYLAGFCLGLIVAAIVWLLWPRRYEWSGDVSLMHVGKIADAVQRHEAVLTDNERRLTALEGER